MSTENESGPWYRGITRYQWTVLIIASLGWVFDIFEGQIFVASMSEAMPSLVNKAEFAAREGFTDPEVIDRAYKGLLAKYNNYALGSFLLGGAFGGILFGKLSDRIGRKRTMTFTILMYSLFTCVSSLSQTWWHLAGLRFLVAMGVGGEWAVASAMVAEVFPKRARAWSLGIFHASSVFGTYLAVAAGTFFIGNEYFHELAKSYDMPSLPWRFGFAVGALPALLIIWIRRSLVEPESWERARNIAAQDPTKRTGAIRELFGEQLLRKTFVGVSLAAIGLATFWGAHIYGKNILKKAKETEYLTAAGVSATATAAQRDAVLKEKVVSAKVKRWEMLGMFLVTTGGGLGLVSFGPICERLGRRGAFLLFHLGGFAAALWLFQVSMPLNGLLLALPVFGFLTLGMHAGYAIYFPELYPTRLRGTGTGFCFNAGRILAAPILFISGWMQDGVDAKIENDWVNLAFVLQPMTLENAASLLSFLFLAAFFILLFAPETRGQDLPE